LGLGLVAEPIVLELAPAASAGKTGCSWALADPAPGLGIGLH
jgi:hypothetical protein